MVQTLYCSAPLSVYVHKNILSANVTTAVFCSQIKFESDFLKRKFLDRLGTYGVRGITLRDSFSSRHRSISKSRRNKNRGLVGTRKYEEC